MVKLLLVILCATSICTYSDESCSQCTRLQFELKLMKQLMAHVSEAYPEFRQQYSDWGQQEITPERLEEYKIDAEAGDIISMQQLAYRYGKGIGVEEDEAEACKWYQILSDMGDESAMLWLGRYYKEGVGRLNKDYSKAFYWLSKCSGGENGIRAMVEIIELYAVGDSTLPKDEAEAQKWIQKARDLAGSGTTRPYAVNQYLLGCEFSEGGRLPTDSEEALKWFWKATDNGHDGALVKIAKAYYSGCGTEKDLDKAWDLLKKAIDWETSNHNFFIRQFSKNETQDVEAWIAKNTASEPVKAPTKLDNMRRPLSSDELKELKEKAASGDQKTLKMLAWRFNKGLGVTRDLVEARKYYQKLAENGDQTAMLWMGRYYQKGTGGLVKDYSKALHWLSQCEDEDKAWSVFELYKLYAVGGPNLPKDEVMANKWLENAIRIAGAGNEKKHQRAQYRLACEFDGGQRIPQSYQSALQWFERAARSGNHMAMVQAAEAHYKGTGTPVNKEKASDWLRKSSAMTGESNVEFFVRQFPPSEAEEVRVWCKQQKF